MSKNNRQGQGMPLPPQAAQPAAPAMPAPPSHEEGQEVAAAVEAPAAADAQDMLQAKLAEMQQALEKSEIEKAEMRTHLEHREQQFEKLQDQMSVQSGEFARLKRMMEADSGAKKSSKPVKIDPMEVEATRPGFYGGYRRPTGSKFIIKGEHELGKWMKVLGPAKAQVKNEQV